ncbi:hypothetical protein FRC04_009010 [Tulasnella sp. 424]|nr:hypothetical protein FRC04_009010 [Tulasnella sp. 424]KAG8973664.1 hypothetical protein FRC05_008601 [Tulasnella sp. 425]
MSALLLYALFNTNSSPGMESEFSNDSGRASPPSSSSATSVSADSFLSTGIDNSPFASFQSHPMSSMSPSSSTSAPDLASLFPGMDMNLNNLQIGQQDPRRLAETSIAASNATAAFTHTLAYPLDPAAAADGAAAGHFIQGGQNLVDPLAFLEQPPHPSLMHSQSHFQHQQRQAFHHQHHQQQQHQQHHAQLPAYQRHRAFTTSAASDPSAILSIHRPSSATATSNTATASSANMFDPLDLSTYAMAGVSRAAPGYAISGGEEGVGGPAIDSPTVQHQQGHSSPMNSHGPSGSPTTLAHRDSLSSSSSENTEVGAKEATPAAQTDAASSTATTAAGDDAPAPPVVKAGRKLPKPVTDFLRKWLLEHADHPYPNEQEKKMLCEKTGLTMHQLSNWMINARRRILVPASKVIQTIGSSPYSMGQRRSTSALAAAHAYRVVDPSSAGPSGSTAGGPAPSHYIPHLLPEQLAAGVQRSQRGLAPTSGTAATTAAGVAPPNQAQAAGATQNFPGRGLQRSGTFPPPVSRDATGGGGLYSSSSPSASSATGSTSSSASPNIPAHPSVPIPPRLLPAHIMAPQPVYPVSAPASSNSPANNNSNYPSPTASAQQQQPAMMNAYARREAELAAYANEARQLRILQQQASQQQSFTTLQHAVVPRQQQQQQQQFPGQQGSQMGSTSSSGIAYPPGQNPSAGAGSSAGFFNF